MTRIQMLEVSKNQGSSWNRIAADLWALILQLGVWESQGHLVGKSIHEGNNWSCYMVYRG